MNRDEILPDFMRREIEREIYAAEHPVGMSTHDGKAKIQATTLRRLMRLVAEIERLRVDAERYRYLKDRAENYDGHACFPDVRYVAPIPDCSPFCPVDAAVDAAIAEERKP